MNLFLQIVINGILLGGLYAIMAQGLALVWGVLNIVNLAHGTMIMLGGYVTWLVFANFGIDPFIGVFAAAAVMFCFGYALQRCVLNLVARGPMFNALLITFGIEIIFTDVAQHVFSADFRAIIPSYSAVNFNVYGITIPLMNLLAFIAAFVVSGFMFFFMMTRNSAAPFAPRRKTSPQHGFTVLNRAIFMPSPLASVWQSLALRAGFTQPSTSSIPISVCR